MSTIWAATIEEMAIGYSSGCLLACLPTLPQPIRNVVPMLTTIVSIGLPPLGDGDAYLPRPYRPAAIHLAPQALYLHLGEPHSSEVTIWHEGTTYSIGGSTSI
jgi:hypothetical protein